MAVIIVPPYAAINFHHSGYFKSSYEVVSSCTHYLPLGNVKIDFFLLFSRSSVIFLEKVENHSNYSNIKRVFYEE